MKWEAKYVAAILALFAWTASGRLVDGKRHGRQDEAHREPHADVAVRLPLHGQAGRREHPDLRRRATVAERSQVHRSDATLALHVSPRFPGTVVSCEIGATSSGMAVIV